ncbi:hypothetical protein H5P28_02870 [Ruficoccus amylovorans]|uniref:Uncharacterized protein n=1 Tax=Ruficoccus amylovorans TaxID=1804625 RepID=A0A842HA59_9BACT|nr:hypothetical protein [Ruficoccus amylovorans]MBC2593195.1 hypothetical protein [Ruficoccus amylovorans]
MLSLATALRGQEDSEQPVTIEQIVVSAGQEPGQPLSDEALREILGLYVGSWRGSIDLTDKFGSVIQTLAVESEYRLENVNGKEVLLGRFKFGQGKDAKYSSSEAEIGKGFLINRIDQQGKNTVYRGDIEDGKIAWREYGAPRSEYNVFFESFGQRNGRRICSTQSRNLMRDRDGVEQTYFTAGRSLYNGPLDKWTLPAPAFQKPAVAESASPTVTSESAAPGDLPPTGATASGESAAASAEAQGATSAEASGSLMTLGEMSRRRAVESAAIDFSDPKVAQAEVASLHDQLEAERAVSAKLRIRIARLEARITELTGENPVLDDSVESGEATASEATTPVSGTSGASESTADSSSTRSSFRTRSR